MPSGDGVALPGHPSLRFRPLSAADVPRAFAIEVEGYPPEEAATLEKLEYRQRVAPELFYGVYEADGDALLGFVVSTAAAGERLEEESMSRHVPGGASICIHSVAVAMAHQRKGIARAMVRAYVDALAADVARCGSARRVLLIAHAPLLGLYAQCGFEFVGPSSVVHGPEQWFEMRLDLVSRRHLDFLQVDAFTPVALAGNPAAILFTHRGGNEDWMQAVAVENNLSETAFLQARQATPGAGASAWDIRWFTPGGEVALCGHATLASAHALWETGRVPAGSPIEFHTRKAGVLTCTTGGPYIKMDFPAQPPAVLPESHARAELAAALGVKEGDVLFLGKGPPEVPDWFLEVYPTAFAGMEPDLGALAKVKPMDRGVIVTCAGAGGSADGDPVQPVPPAPKRPRVLFKDAGVGHAAERFDFISRFFAPTLGLGEDPVTGSAHCLLAPYWAAKLHIADGAPMQALQASPRGGLLRVRYKKSAGRVEIEGQAVTVIRGKLAA